MYDILIIFFYLVMTGDDLAASDAIGIPGIIPSRAAKTSFVTTAGGRALYAHQIFRPRSHRHCCRPPPPTPSLRPCCHRCHRLRPHRRPSPTPSLHPPTPSLRPCCRPRPRLCPRIRPCLRPSPTPSLCPPTPSLRPRCRPRPPPSPSLRCRPHRRRRPPPATPLSPSSSPMLRIRTNFGSGSLVKKLNNFKWYIFSVFFLNF